ncbi:MAG TPA: hypothetical protein VGJ60_15045 [Chloroflexota bacterium]
MEKGTMTNSIRIVRRSATKQIAAAQTQGAAVLDLTSRGEQPWIQFSPFYPHRRIPVPLSDGYTTACVEGAWQALKVFESADVDLSKLRVADMKGLKRSVRTNGRVLGHRAGVGSSKLLGYVAARKAIYLPLYRWTLENCLAEPLEAIRQLLETQDVVLLDYETNGDVDDASSPLSHAALVKAYLEDSWPT